VVSLSLTITQISVVVALLNRENPENRETQKEKPPQSMTEGAFRCSLLFDAR